MEWNTKKKMKQSGTQKTEVDVIKIYELMLFHSQFKEKTKNGRVEFNANCCTIRGRKFGNVLSKHDQRKSQRAREIAIFMFTLFRITLLYIYTAHIGEETILQYSSIIKNITFKKFHYFLSFWISRKSQITSTNISFQY